MNKKSKPSVEVLSEIMQRSLSKDPALAAKQARLLEKLRNDPSSPLYAGSSPPAQPSQKSPPKADDVAPKPGSLRGGRVPCWTPLLERSARRMPSSTSEPTTPSKGDLLLRNLLRIQMPIVHEPETPEKSSEGASQAELDAQEESAAFVKYRERQRTKR